MSALLPLASTKSTIADYVHALFLVYIVLIFIRVLLSWIPRIPYHPVLRAVLDFIHQTTDPYLNIFRRILPPIGAGGMALDISPIVAVIVLLLADGLVVGAILE